MLITIDPYDSKSIDNAIKQLEKYKTYIQTKEQELLTRLAEIGVDTASVLFDNAWYDGTNDVTVSKSDITTTLKENTITISAKGQAVAFIEFGTGVTYGYGYMGTKPSGIKDIGQYGHGLGKLKNGWRYPTENGLGTNGVYDTKHKGYIHTYGNPPAMAMWKSTQDIQAKVEQIAREVFGNDR